MQILVSLSDVFYRGEGRGSDSKIIEWLTPDYEHAEGYAKYRNGKVREVELSLNREKVVSFSHDSMIVTPQEFTTKALRQVDRSYMKSHRDEMMEAQTEFLKHFGHKNRIPVMDYWQNETDKKAVRNLLVAYGFTVIGVLESKHRVETYGRLSK